MSDDEKRSYHQQRTDLPPPPTDCPLHATWSPLNPDYVTDPYAIAAALRDEQGVFYAETLGYLVVTRMEDIEQIFTDHEAFASVNVQDPVFPLAAEAQAILSAEDFNPVAVMSNRSEPDHGRIRVYTRAGSQKRIKRRALIRRPSQSSSMHARTDRPLSPSRRLLPAATPFSLHRFPTTTRRSKHWCGDPSLS